MRTMLIIATILLAGVAAAQAPFDSSDWNWSGAITADSSGFVRLALTPEVFDQSQPSLSDLRVIDETGALVPHVVHRERAAVERQVQWRNVELVNKTFAPSGYARVTLDFGDRIKKNQIKLAQSETNFRRRISVEGSADNQNFEKVLEDGYLFDITLPEKRFSVDTAEFPTNDFRYLRITVSAMADDPRRIEITSAQAALSETRPGTEPIPVPVASQVNSLDEKRKESVFDLDLAYRNLPLIKAVVAATDTYFFRGYELLGRNSTTEPLKRRTETGWDTSEHETPWQSVARGVLYRVQEDGKVKEQTTIEGLNGGYRYLQLRVSNADNPPLSVSGIAVFRGSASVVFDSRPPHTYSLIGGNLQASAPSYDLAQSVKGVGESNLPAAKPGAITPLSHAPKLPPWTERNAVLIWLVLIAALAVMLVLILGNLRKMRQTDH